MKSADHFRKQIHMVCLYIFLISSSVPDIHTIVYGLMPCILIKQITDSILTITLYYNLHIILRGRNKMTSRERKQTVDEITEQTIQLVNRLSHQLLLYIELTISSQLTAICIHKAILTLGADHEGVKKLPHLILVSILLK